MFQWSLKSWWKNRNDRVEIIGRTEGISSNRLCFPHTGFTHEGNHSLTELLGRRGSVSLSREKSFPLMYTLHSHG